MNFQKPQRTNKRRKVSPLITVLNHENVMSSSFAPKKLYEQGIAQKVWCFRTQGCHVLTKNARTDEGCRSAWRLPLVVIIRNEQQYHHIMYAKS